MTLSLRVGFGALAAFLLIGCSSVSDETRRKCATATDPSACQRAEALKQRQLDGDRLEENSQRGGGGGY
ncbi:MAG TPA: hypothetical protein VGB82_21565 [Alphaproteobacteria bacterium]